MVRGSAWLRQLLTHPLMMAVKRPVKDALWRLRGRALVNPTMPARVESILFVCLGNICRSPFAAVRATQLLADQGLGAIRCSSAGITAKQAARPPHEAYVVAAAFGSSLDGHKPQPLTQELIDAYDLIVVMEASQLSELRQRYPDAVSRIVLLSLMGQAHGGYARYNIADPFGLDLDAFRACYARIDHALMALLSGIARPVPREDAKA